MTAAESIADKARSILEIALSTPLAGVPNPERDSIEVWDSFAQIELVFMLEEQFGVKFAPDEIERLDSLNAIVAAVAAANAA